MADNILRLKVESSEYDAKLKKAAEGIRHLAEVAHKGGGELTGLEKAELDYVKALGSMETKSRTAAGGVRELESTFKELTVVYNNLNDVEKQDEGGKALRASLDQIKQRAQEARKELESASKALGDVEVKPKGGFFDGLGSKMEGALAVFGGNLMTKAAGAVAQLGSEMVGLVQQGIEMAKQGEGVRIAFERLGRGDILQGLREATHGTVTDLELMKAAVKFNDFKLPLDELGTMLAFAQQKAKDTGQSVDFLVESIVNGLGRKSLMILDNLGLSATEIRERMKETGDMTKAVGAIIRDQMAAAGDYVETAADRAAQANVSLQNKMEELGRKFAPIEEASNQLWTSMKIGILDIIGGPLATLLNQLTEAGRLKNALNDINGDGSNGNTVVGGKLKQLQAAKNSGASQYILNTMQSSTIEGYNRQITKADELLKQFEKNHSSVNVVLQNATKQFGQKFSSISELEAFRDAYKVMVSDYRKGANEIMKPVKVNIQTGNAIKSVDELKVKLAELQAQRKKVAAGSDEAKRLDTEIRQVKADIKLQDPNVLKTTTTKGTNDDFTEIIGLIGNAQERVSDLQRRIKEAPDETTITTLRDQLKEAQAELDRLNGKKVEMTQGLSGFNTQTMGAWMQGRQSDLSKTELGSVDYSKIMGNIADMQTIKSIIEQSMAAGIDAAQFDLEPLWEKVFDGENIPDDVWQNIVDTINAKLAELELEPIKLDFKTGNITKLAKDSKDLAKDWSAAGSAISSVSAAMSQIDDPAAKVIGTIAQAVAAVALGASQAIAQASNGSAGGPWGWIAFAAAATATMISTIATIHNATGFAQGGIVDGRGGGFVGGMAYSGDNVGNVRLDSGELVLNRAQQNNLANQLEGGSVWQNLVLETVISGEDIRLVLNDNGRRTGRGEYVQTNRR